MRKALSIMGIILILTGCTIAETPTNLMEAPTYGSWLNELKEQMNKDLPVNYRLLTPISNRDKQTIWTMNINEDGKKEVVIFYKQSNEDYQVYLSFYKETDKGWKLQLTRTFIGEGLDYVAVGDFTGNHKKEILVGISTNREVSQNVVYAFSLEQNNITEIYNRDYTKLFVDDLNANGINDISLVTYKKNQRLQVDFIEEFKIVSNVSFDPYINEIQKIQLGHISKQKKAIVIDVGAGAHSGITYIAKFENSHFEKVFLDEDNPLINDFVLESQDVNRDGIIEFATTVQAKGWEEHSHAESPQFERYVQLDGNSGFKLIEERYINVEQGYFVKIPRELIGKITLSAENTSKNIQSFLYADTNEPWLEVHTFKHKEWLNVQDYEAAVKTTSRVYAVPKQFKYNKLKSYIKPLAEYQQE
ncbi:hypothetical protein [Bacillus gaemokensis]|uniref:Lipoprotein n=1 Tax=Bacillus gaemokensis TaxID=574375 RepID=A0A073KCG5_9BACI|nr:hypothetical protein [Bacillus gaemokensis]KEK24162.1 hypothetical protein BAGA_29355 [Bacillus gaemokensis]KYG32695.1 hypothetical protein AZF08_11435 [Bacillus gaemokensis]